MAAIVDRQNLDFLLFEVLGLDGLIQHERFSHLDRTVIGQAMDSAQAIAVEVFQPSAARLDQNPPVAVNGKVSASEDVTRALRAYAEAGLPAQGFDHEQGGLQFPFVLTQAINGMFNTANLPLFNYWLLTTAAANLLQTFGADAQKQTFAAPMIEGRWTGTMCLSEPQAGSSLSDITTRAQEVGDGTYHIKGTKMWISGAGHDFSENIINLVLAKIPGGPPGVKGISLFIVPQRLVGADGSVGELNNVTLVGLNHKMGQRATTNCMLNFGESGPTVGYLIGEPNQGLRYMFQMMNEARISVGHGATMSGLSGYLYSLEYARDRLQGRKPVQKDPTSPQIPIVAHADVRRMLLAQKAQVEGAMALCGYAATLVDQKAISASEQERHELELLLEVLTPIVKSWPSEYCLEANKLAIQILGGAGYTTDHPVERFYRDNRLNHIHEGALGIQGIDMLGRKVRMESGLGLELVFAKIGSTIAEAGGSAELKPYAEQLARGVSAWKAATVSALACPDTERSLANATLYLDAAGLVVVGWLWLKQAVAANAGLGKAPGSSFYAGKLAACRYYFRYMLPQSDNGFALVEQLDDTCLMLEPDMLVGQTG